MTAAPLSVPRVPKTAWGRWWDQGRDLAQRIETARWALGDWWRSPERPNDVTVDTVANELGLAPAAIWQAAWLANRFPPSRRRNCSHSHHQEVAALSPAVADALLDQAVAERWTVARIRQAARKAAREQVIEAERAERQIELDLTPNAIAWRSDAERVVRECREVLVTVEAQLRVIVGAVEAQADHPGAKDVDGNARLALTKRLRETLAPGRRTGVDLTPFIQPALDRIWTSGAAARVKETAS